MNTSIDIIKYKQIVCREVDSLSNNDKKKLRNIIKRTSSKYIKQFNDGLRVNLDLLPDEVNIELFNFINYKLNLNSC